MFKLILRIVALASVIITGFYAKNFWVGLLVAIGLLLLHSPNKEKSSTFLIKIFLGLAFVAGATWLAEFAGRWVWTAVWLLAAFGVFSSNTQQKQHRAKWRTIFEMSLGLVVLIFAIVNPYLADGGYKSEGFIGWLFVWFFLITLPIFVFVIKLSAKEPGFNVQVLRLGIGILLVIGIFSGFITRIIWVPFLILAGLFLLFRNYQRWQEGALYQYRINILELLAGMMLLLAASILAGLETWWLWTTIWFLASLPAIMLGSYLFEQEETKGMHLGGVFSLILGVLSLLFAIVGPFVLKDMEILPAVITFLLISGGVLLLVMAWDASQTKKEFRTVLLAIAGTFLYGVSSFFSDFSAGWVWTVLWLFGMILLAISAFSLRNIVVKLLVLGIAVLFLFIAFQGPMVFKNFNFDLTNVFSSQNTKWVGPVLIGVAGLVVVSIVSFYIFMAYKKKQIERHIESLAQKPDLLGSMDALMMLLGEKTEGDKNKKK